MQYFLAVVYCANWLEHSFSKHNKMKKNKICFLAGLQARENIHSCRRSNAVNSEKLLEDDLRSQLCRGGDDIRFN